MPEETVNRPEENYSEVVAIRREKLKALQESGRDPFQKTRYDRTHYSAEILDDFDALENQTVSICGRIMSCRDMGKASFAHIQDGKGQIQLYVRINDVGEEAYAEFRKMDIGDIIGATGFVFRTRRGEISVHCQKLELLSKSLLPLPEKYHGMTNTELRYRQRYVDLIMNPQARHTFEVRSKFVREIRNYMDSLGFMEVETPVLNTISGGATARPFVTHHNTLDIDMYMRIATELHLKRLIVGGFERVYEIGRIFRNEGMDPKHNPEFTTIEAYQAYTNLDGMMDLAEGLFTHCADKILGSYKLTYQGEEIDLTPPFRRVTMADIVKEKTGVDFNVITDLEEAKKAVKGLGLDLEGKDTLGDLLYLCFDELVEKTLRQPTFVTMYPVEVSPLAKRSPENPALTERFEMFICGTEFGNAFSELNDPIDQKERFQRQVDMRAKGDEEAGMMDLDYINALEYGMPPTGGIGIGIDRAVMLFTDSASIRDVILFPTMKNIKTGSEAQEEAKKTPEAAPAAPIVEEKIDFSNVQIEPLFEEFVDFETFSKSDFRAVKVLECEAVPKSKKLLKFTLDDGTGVNRTILSGIHAFYEPEELVGKTLIAITNLPPRLMMGIDSCGMLLSAINKRGEEEELNLLMVDPHIPAGAKLY